MHLKSFLIVNLILTIVIFPSVCGNFLISEKKTTNDDIEPLENSDMIKIKFGYGEISDVRMIRSGYTIIGWKFYAEDVICLTNLHDRPVFHHFIDGEELWIAVTKMGILHDDFICAFSFF